MCKTIQQMARFNTQPPEGGWLLQTEPCQKKMLFQHTAARRRLDACSFTQFEPSVVSTHSRPKAAGLMPFFMLFTTKVSTHSRPKAAG